MRRLAALALGPLALALALGACGTTEEATPVACLEGTKAYLQALEEAPKPVRLPGGTRISDCLTKNQGGGVLATMGGSMVRAATALNAAARHDPSGPAAVRLGFLLGAVERGAEDTHGIHAELVRRLESAAKYSPGGRPLPRRLERAYETGFEAGQVLG
ncbi:MAG TPA: hypothetical protein VGF09_06215 [Solirubrobacterales bacterium]|jgi:hypothetical protein